MAKGEAPLVDSPVGAPVVMGRSTTTKSQLSNNENISVCKKFDSQVFRGIYGPVRHRGLSPSWYQISGRGISDFRGLIMIVGVITFFGKTERYIDTKKRAVINLKNGVL